MKNIYCILFLAAISFVSCDNDSGDTYDVIAQFNADVETIDEYLASTGTEAIKDNSGVRIVLTSIGQEGLPPRRDQSVKVKFKGTLLSNGSVFEEGTAEGVLFNSLPGWVEGIEILPEGSVARLYIPSPLGFRNTSRTGVPPNSILVYDIELLDVAISETEKQQFTADTTAINKYLKDNAIEALSAPFGVKYTITEQGTGPIPGWYSQISVTYESTLLTSDEAFFNGTVEPDDAFDSRVVDFLPGLQVAFQSFPPGTKAIVYIPSTLAFGSEGAGGGKVPPNSNIIYEINSFQVVNQ